MKLLKFEIARTSYFYEQNLIRKMAIMIAYSFKKIAQFESHAQRYQNKPKFHDCHSIIIVNSEKAKMLLTNLFLLYESK